MKFDQDSFTQDVPVHAIPLLQPHLTLPSPHLLPKLSSLCLNGGGFIVASGNLLSLILLSSFQLSSILLPNPITSLSTTSSFVALSHGFCCTIIHLPSLRVVTTISNEQKERVSGVALSSTFLAFSVSHHIVLFKVLDENHFEVGFFKICLLDPGYFEIFAIFENSLFFGNVENSSLLYLHLQQPNSVHTIDEISQLPKDNFKSLKFCQSKDRLYVYSSAKLLILTPSGSLIGSIQRNFNISQIFICGSDCFAIVEDKQVTIFSNSTLDSAQSFSLPSKVLAINTVNFLDLTFLILDVGVSVALVQYDSDKESFSISSKFAEFLISPLKLLMNRITHSDFLIMDSESRCFYLNNTVNNASLKLFIDFTTLPLFSKGSHVSAFCLVNSNTICCSVVDVQKTKSFIHLMKLSANHWSVVSSLEVPNIVFCLKYFNNRLYVLDCTGTLAEVHLSNHSALLPSCFLLNSSENLKFRPSLCRIESGQKVFDSSTYYFLLSQKSANSLFVCLINNLEVMSFQIQFPSELSCFCIHPSGFVAIAATNDTLFWINLINYSIQKISNVSEICFVSCSNDGFLLFLSTSTRLMVYDIILQEIISVRPFIQILDLVEVNNQLVLTTKSGLIIIDLSPKVIDLQARYKQILTNSLIFENSAEFWSSFSPLLSPCTVSMTPFENDVNNLQSTQPPTEDEPNALSYDHLSSICFQR
ncbi:hypothetical protein GEMRC1_012198 [Eukaryota sp. GEM-RC1]